MNLEINTQLITSETFLEFCKQKKYSSANIEQFKQAILFIDFLKNKPRLATGDTFFDHNLRVGFILAENKALPAVVLGGLLHTLTLDQEKEKILLAKFGQEVFSLIKGIEEIKQLKFKNSRLDAESLRKIIFTTLKDVRVILIQLANKLDNLHTINALPITEQKRIAEEVLEFYAPLAYRLGIEKIKAQLEDSAFQILHPDKYREINNFLKSSQDLRDKIIQEVIAKIIKIVEHKVRILKIKGRSKQIYSIYKKIKNKKISLNDLYDLSGIRILVPEIKDCYSLLGLIHETFEPIEGRLKDYIATPKQNFYRSIHTAVRLSNQQIIEIQIRTLEMDELAEEGVAAHWRYKGLNSEKFFEKKVAWLRNVLDIKETVRNKEFLETAKVDIFGDHMFCYTPKGDAKELPLGATILDFAFLIHEQVGIKTVGAKVNGKFVSLRTILSPNDVVEIITNKNQRPRRSWIKIVKSGKAKQKIRKYLREYETLPALHYRDLKPALLEEQSVLVESADFPTALCVLTKCCNPLPGEKIIGIITKRRQVSVHKEECKHALKEEDRWISVNWKNTFNQKIHFFVYAQERSGVLADLLNTIARAGFEVKEAKAKMSGLNDVLCSFLVVPRDLEHLKELIKRVNKIRGIKKIYFE